jgi:isopentenyl diphosphate isomerase/L-lactate dehydrogenase-like FMN-dependent dehydrogenase
MTEIGSNRPPRPAESFFTSAELIEEAYARLNPSVWGYVAGGAESETSKLRNREAFESWAFRARVMRRVDDVQMHTQLLGSPLRIPVLFAPMGSMDSFVENGGAAAVEAACRFGTLPIVSSVTPPSPEACARVAEGDKWFQLYVRGDEAWIKDRVSEIKAAGYKALLLTVDTAVYSIRERQIAERWLPPTQRGPKGPDYGAMLDWDVASRIKDMAGIPVFLKGIQTAQDAHLSLQRGFDAVYVSNHGGRQLDHSLGTLDMLPEIAEEIGGRIPIILDGAVSRGSDIVKALALGASAVAVGRLQAYALAAAGVEGAMQLLTILEKELRTTMALLGVTAIDQITKDYVTKVAPAAHSQGPFPHLPKHIRL